MIKSMMLTLLLTLGLSVTGTTASVAQDNTQDSASKSGPLNFIIKEEDKENIDFDKLFSELPEDIQFELAKEAENQYNECNRRGTFSSFYDCKCVAEEYLHARILQGPGPAKRILVREVTLKCPNTPGIAGLQYQQCHTTYEFSPVFDLDEFCKCYANSVAKSFTKKPSMQSDYLGLLQGRALQECGYMEDLQKFQQLQKDRNRIR